MENKHNILLFKENKPIVLNRDLLYPVKFDKSKIKINGITKPSYFNQNERLFQSSTENKAQLNPLKVNIENLISRKIFLKI